MASQTDDKIFDELDKAKIDEQVRSQAEEIATSKVKELQSKIGEAVGAKQDDDKYASMSDMKADIDRRAEEKANEAADRIKTEIQEETETKVKAAQEVEDSKIQQTKEDQDKEWARLTDEWKEAVEDGVVPSPSDEIMDKLVKGTALTPEDKKDKGIQFYSSSVKRHAELKSQGKAKSFYRTMTQMDKKPSSATAPVFGGSVATPRDTEESTDSQINEATNRALGMGLPT